MSKAPTLDCQEDLKKALDWGRVDNPKFAKLLLARWQGCHLTHESCEFRGADCAVQDVIEGFVMLADERDERAGLLTKPTDEGDT